MKKILILATDRALSEVLKEKLSYLSFDVKTLSNSDTIFGTINEFRPDVLLIDFILQDNNGGSICHQVKCNIDTHALPVIILAEYPEFGFFSKKFGCDALIPKPIDFTELAAKINGYLERTPTFTGKQNLLNMNHHAGILQD